ncbi:hypothetical protein [Bacteroides reticulotermitis]|uniref:Major fimbrial subunit protein N-terminal domain-containing protein n=1 Tax=Bacteroides reticulotermitis JCM 10512 TaxID=1445607 RepID=W4UTS9_9BACE|nr:hypothetical protein [Bacteroides reticulotermitis]GAE84227.1 hypothetical protein JCM10512_2556 [Bacteroides reticulotermitis JCM 10512]
MKRMSIEKIKIRTATCLALAVLLLLLFTGCMTDQHESVRKGGSVYITLALNTGNTSGTSATRAMPVAADEEIRNASVLVFKKEAADREILDYQAEIVGNISGSNGEFSAIVKLQKSVDNEQYSLVVIANKGNDIGYNYYGKTKAELQQALVFDCTDRWKAALDGSTDYDPIPMWGEVGAQVINESISFENSSKVNMLRSLARFDVGLMFDKQENSEVFLGLAGYELQTVHLYRSRDKAYVIPVEANYSVAGKVATAASVPATAGTNHSAAVGSGDNGFVYTAQNYGTEMEKKSVREIYVPENALIDFADATNIVVGIKNLATGNVGYYRMDVDADKDGTRESILRNHHYVFSVTAVTGSGMPTPEEAENAASSDISYVVTPWDETVSNVWVSGNYYFKVSQRTVTLHANGKTDVTVEYTTNLPKDKLAFNWESGPASIMLDPATPVIPDPVGGVITGTLTFHAIVNYTGSILMKQLKFTAGDIEGHITAKQASVRMDYGINCSSVKVHGSYMLDSNPDPDKNYITLTLTGIVDDMVGAIWAIETNTSHGLHFSGTGEFTISEDGSMEVTLYADPANKITPTGVAELIINSNSTAGVSCGVNVMIGYKSMSILGTCNFNATYGYAADKHGRMHSLKKCVISALQDGYPYRQ